MACGDGVSPAYWSGLTNSFLFFVNTEAEVNVVLVGSKSLFERATRDEKCLCHLAIRDICGSAMRN
jgi:hypothetical protein